jgi:predicted nucleic acid-binding protein
MEAFDATFLTFLFVPNAPCKVDRARDRVDNLIGDIHGRGDRIIIPAPALSELLIGVGHSKNQILHELTHNPKFLIAPFDTRAALELALMLESVLRRGRKKGKAGGNRAKIKYDHLIVAIAKVCNASAIYSEDADIHKIAGRLGLKAKSVSDLSLPHKRYKGETLFDMDPQQESGGPSKTDKEK